MSVTFKLIRPKPVIKQMTDFGLRNEILLIAIGELVSAILFLIPKPHPLGVLLLSSYMGGAIVTHMQHAEAYVSQSVILLPDLGDRVPATPRPAVRSAGTVEAEHDLIVP